MPSSAIIITRMVIFWPTIKKLEQTNQGLQVYHKINKLFIELADLLKAARHCFEHFEHRSISANYYKIYGARNTANCFESWKTYRRIQLTPFSSSTVWI